MSELAQFDSTEWRSCQQVLAMEDVSVLCLTFEAKDGGAEVTNANVKQYIRLRKNNVLLGARSKWLSAMRKGDVRFLGLLCFVHVGGRRSID